MTKQTQEPLTFAEIESCFPDGGTCLEDGSIVSSAQWLHDFAANLRAKDAETIAQLEAEKETLGRKLTEQQAELTEAQLSRVLDRSHTVRLNDGQWLYRQGDRAERFFVVRDGQVALRGRMGPYDDPLVLERRGHGPSR